jgi:hypothetical protein
MELMKRGNIRGFTWVDRVGLMRMLIDLQASAVKVSALAFRRC